MKKKLYILAAGIGLSCAAGLAANAASLHLPLSTSSTVIRTGSSDGASLPGLPGGKGGKPGNASESSRMADYDVDKLYTYCSKVMDDARRGEGPGDTSDDFVPSDCVDFFVIPSHGGVSDHAGKYGGAEYDEEVFSYCVDLLRHARRDDGLPGYKGKRRIYSSDFSPRDCTDYFASLEKAEKGGSHYGLKRHGRSGASISGGVGGEGGKAGRGAGGGSGGAGGAGVGGGGGGRGGAGGSSD
jgi:hypothetical protein